jgi:hypothetical protein
MKVEIDVRVNILVLCFHVGPIKHCIYYILHYIYPHINFNLHVMMVEIDVRVNILILCFHVGPIKQCFVSCISYMV